MRSRSIVPALAMLLAACGSVVLGACAPGARVPAATDLCLILRDPPAGAVEALAGAAQGPDADPEVAAWIVDLEVYYRQRDACLARE